VAVIRGSGSLLRIPYCSTRIFGAWVELGVSGGDDLSAKVERAAHADGPAFLNT